MFKDEKKKIIRDTFRGSLYELAAKKLGVKRSIIGYTKGQKSDGKIFLRPITKLEKGKKSTLVLSSTTHKTSYLGMKIAVDKILTNQILKANKLPVPEQINVKNKIELKKFLEQYKKIIIKPYDSRCGKDVFTEICDLKKALKIYFSLKNKYHRIIAEEQILGNDYRVLVINYKVKAVLQRIPPYVIGDGRKTILELINQENNLRKRNKKLKPIRIDYRIKYYLKSQGLSLKFIPNQGEKIQISNVANISAGGIGRNVTHKIHPQNKKIAERAAKIINLDVAGVDIIAPSIDKPIRENGGKIIEVNGGPDLKIHYNVFYGKPINPAEEIINYLLFNQ